MKRNVLANEIQLNLCDEFELSKNVNGIGVMLSKRIVNERNKNGDFKDWKDVQKRVYGVGLKTIEKLKNSGVKINTNDQNTERVKQKGFEIKYVNLGPETIFSNKIDSMYKNLKFHMPKKQNNKKRKLDDS